VSKTIRIPADVYKRLEEHARGFDTPANVIERLLNSYEGIPAQEVSCASGKTGKRERDKTKYLFGASLYSKNRLVLAVIQRYVSEHPEINFSELQSAFPKSLQGSTGVFNEVEYVKEKYSGKQNKRHFVKPNEVIQLTDCQVVVCTEWGIGNINDFLHKVEELGYEVQPIEG